MHVARQVTSGFRISAERMIQWCVDKLSAEDMTRKLYVGGVVTQCRSLVCDGEVFAGEFLVLVSYSVADCLVFLLLDYRLIILRSLMKYVFLNPVYSLIEAI